MAMFADLEPRAPDAILGLMERFRADDRPDKVSLASGVFVDETGVTPVLAKPVSISGDLCSGCGGRMRSTTYDTNGFIDSETDANGYLTTTVNNDRGLQESRTEAVGTVGEVKRALARSRRTLGLVPAARMRPELRALGVDGRSLFGVGRVDDLVAIAVAVDAVAPLFTETSTTSHSANAATSVAKRRRDGAT